MKLTKEECLDIINFLDFFYGDNLIATAKLREEKPKEIQEEDARNFKNKLGKLEQLINEHFDNNMARTCQNLVSEIDKLEKALDKACDELTKQNDGEYWKKSQSIDNKEEWKEYLFNETN